AGQVADDERAQVIGDELLLAEAGERRLRRHAGPQPQHDERERGREHPDDELDPVGDRLGQADPQHGRDGADGGAGGRGHPPPVAGPWPAWASGRRNSWRMVSSTGGSSTLRSTTGSVASEWLTTSRNAAWPTRRTTRPASELTTSPSRSSWSGATGPVRVK